MLYCFSCPPRCSSLQSVSDPQRSTTLELSQHGVSENGLTTKTSRDRLLTYSATIAPAAEAVEYQSVKFNVTTKGNRFVGAGPEVDKAWREISYDSKGSLSPVPGVIVNCSLTLTFKSG